MPQAEFWFTKDEINEVWGIFRPTQALISLLRAKFCEFEACEDETTSNLLMLTHDRLKDLEAALFKGDKCGRQPEGAGEAPEGNQAVETKGDKQGPRERFDQISYSLHSGPETTLRLILAFLELGAFKKGGLARAGNGNSLMANLYCLLWAGVREIEKALAVCVADAIEPESYQGLNPIKEYLDDLLQSDDSWTSSIDRRIFTAHLSILDETGKAIEKAYKPLIEAGRIGS